MIDPTHTTIDWQQHPGDILVLPIGATEQHGRHLPLNTDTIHADYFARQVAEHFDAALLPTLPISNSLEHAGFRGSFSLRPETLMQVVRDLADEAQQQNFRFLIILNGHGGNFALGPVIRDINRQDRPLKILLVHSWQFADPDACAARRDGAFDIHAGEVETSGMMHIASDVVRPLSPENTRQSFASWDEPFVQSDLNTFGMGCYSALGPVGDPANASAEQGRAMDETNHAPMMRSLEHRIGQLRLNPRYAGHGGLSIRAVVTRDMPDLLRLVESVGWNQTEADWQNLMGLAPEGCRVMVNQGRAVGSVSVLRYEDQLAWIGMLIVDPAWRRQGIATRMLHDAIAAAGDVSCVKLDATPEGQKVYEQHGFVAEFPLGRWVAAAPRPGGGAGDSAVRAMSIDDLPAVNRLDRQAIGVDRAGLLQRLYEQAPELAWVVADGPQAGAAGTTGSGTIRGFCLGRRGRRLTQVGPIVIDATRGASTSATTSPVNVATSLLEAAARQCGVQPVAVDAVQLDDAAHEAWIDQLQSMGFARERPLMRMARPANAVTGCPDAMFAVAGYEFG